MRVAPSLDLPTTDDDAGSEKKLTTPAPRRNGLKSGKTHTADTTLLRKITWPHEVVYTSSGHPTVFEEMSMSLFVSGYLTVIAGEKDQIKPYMIQHLQELIDDAESLVWEPVRAYYAVWLQQLEEGRTSWSDDEKKMEYH